MLHLQNTSNLKKNRSHNENLVSSAQNMTNLVFIIMILIKLIPEEGGDMMISGQGLLHQLHPGLTSRTKHCKPHILCKQKVTITITVPVIFSWANHR